MGNYVGIERFAEIYGCSRKYALELVRKGHAPRHIKVGRQIRFLEEDIVAWIKTHTVNPDNK